jgi:hydroxymethylpyrimidine pyrophosphatase-like HAD family hydrolase
MAIDNIFMDMDGTICESRQVISDINRDYLNKLGKNLFVISGAKRTQMEKQLQGLNCIILAQSGNDTPRWKKKLTTEEKRECYEHIARVKHRFPQYFTKPFYDLIQDRGCQVSLSLLGHEMPIEEKLNFDPTKIVREEILKAIPFQSETLMTTIAGTTCFDYTRKDGNKGENLKEWIKDLPNESCIYFGDGLFKGGNDETVIGVMRTMPVDSPKFLLLIVNEVLS